MSALSPPMNAYLETMHARYVTQSRWTQALRQNLIKRISLPARPRALEVGSGTGCISSWTAQVLRAVVHGIDIDFPSVQFALQNDPDNVYAQADGLALPFPNNYFDLVFSHFLLLWTLQPLAILQEMQRCVRPGGWVIAFAEPDYGGRIDYPSELARIGELQAQALQASGAVPTRGREIRALFNQAGLTRVLAGVLGGEWQTDPPDDRDSEWSILQYDLAGRLSTDEFSQLRSLDLESWQSQVRVLFTPTFYAIGQKLT